MQSNGGLTPVSKYVLYVLCKIILLPEMCKCCTFAGFFNTFISNVNIKFYISYIMRIMPINYGPLIAT